MATGRGLQTTGQVGEYLVAAELCRRGYTATTFTRNVPYFDILAINDKNEAQPIQVKSIRGATWQFDAGAYLDISFSNCQQEVAGKKKLIDPEMILVLVKLVTLGKDEFFILKARDLQDLICRQYADNLKKHNNCRPKSPESTHTAVSPADVEAFRDNWDLLCGNFCRKIL